MNRKSFAKGIHTGTCRLAASRGPLRSRNRSRTAGSHPAQHLAGELPRPPPVRYYWCHPRSSRSRKLPHHQIHDSSGRRSNLCNPPMFAPGVGRKTHVAPESAVSTDISHMSFSPSHKSSFRVMIPSPPCCVLEIFVHALHSSASKKPEKALPCC